MTDPQAASPAKRNKANRADIVVYMPDGCRFEWSTHRTGPIAFDAVKFGRWLVERGEQVIEAATTPGQCATTTTATEDEVPHG